MKKKRLCIYMEDDIDQKFNMWLYNMYRKHKIKYSKSHIVEQLVSKLLEDEQRREEEAPRRQII